jgi:hypothetical protein
MAASFESNWDLFCLYEGTSQSRNSSREGSYVSSSRPGNSCLKEA